MGSPASCSIASAKSKAESALRGDVRFRREIGFAKSEECCIRMPSIGIRAVTLLTVRTRAVRVAAGYLFNNCYRDLFPLCADDRYFRIPYLRARVEFATTSKRVLAAAPRTP